MRAKEKRKEVEGEGWMNKSPVVHLKKYRGHICEHWRKAELLLSKKSILFKSFIVEQNIDSLEAPLKTSRNISSHIYVDINSTWYYLHICNTTMQENFTETSLPNLLQKSSTETGNTRLCYSTKRH